MSTCIIKDQETQLYTSFLCAWVAGLKVDRILGQGRLSELRVIIHKGELEELFHPEATASTVFHSGKVCIYVKLQKKCYIAQFMERDMAFTSLHNPVIARIAVRRFCNVMFC